MILNERFIAEGINVFIEGVKGDAALKKFGMRHPLSVSYRVGLNILVSNSELK